MSDLYDPKYIAENVYHLRKKHFGLSQEAFSEKTNLSKDTISNIERGVYKPNIDTLVSISNSTGVSLEYFFQELPKER